MTSKNGFQLRLATVEDSEKILSHVRKHFFQNEPLCSSLKLVELNDEIPVESEECSVESVKQNMTIIALDEFSNVIGASINELKHKEEPNVESECSNPKLAKIYRLLDHVDEECDVFGKYPNIDKVLCIHILSVDSGWRRKGIAKELILETMKTAKNCNIPLVQMGCTSHFSAKLAEQLNFNCLYKKKYEDYRENGNPVFVTEYPHEEVGIYVQHIN